MINLQHIGVSGYELSNGYCIRDIPSTHVEDACSHLGETKIAHFLCQKTKN